MLVRLVLTSGNLSTSASQSAGYYRCEPLCPACVLAILIFLSTAFTYIIDNLLTKLFVISDKITV